MDSSCVIYSGQREDFVNWEHYMEKSGNTLCRLLKEQGYSCQSFATADKELLDSLYQSGYNNFHNMLDVKPFFDDPNHCMDKTMSFLEQKDGIVTAYTLVRRPDKKNVVFEHISCHQDHIGSGCILLPFAQSMKMFQKYGCQRGVYAMYEENSHANAFRKKLLKMVTSSCRRSYNFIYAK